MSASTADELAHSIFLRGSLPARLTAVSRRDKDGMQGDVEMRISHVRHGCDARYVWNAVWEEVVGFVRACVCVRVFHCFQGSIAKGSVALCKDVACVWGLWMTYTDGAWFVDRGLLQV